MIVTWSLSRNIILSTREREMDEKYETVACEFYAYDPGYHNHLITDAGHRWYPTTYKDVVGIEWLSPELEERGHGLWHWCYENS